MKRFKKVVLMVAAITVLGASAAYAAAAPTPAEITSSLTGKSVEAVVQERAAGKTFGAIANEAGKLDEFKAQMLEQKKAVLDQRVAEGRLTRDRADAIYNNIKNNQANCDGSGNAGIGKNAGLGFGQGQGQGKGMGNGRGACDGSGICNGSGLGAGRGLNR
ncbi:MAG: DUF2680 domain-containing protein [Syntrophomonadaceae bacterium]